MEEHLKDLKPAHATFVTEYLKNGGNATAAYKVAYPEIAQESAEASASRLLRNDKVAQAVTAGKAQLAQAAQSGLDDAAKYIRQGITMAGITKERVLVEMARMGFANVGDLAEDDWSVKDKSALSEDEQRALAGLETTTTTSEKGDVSVKVKLKLDKLGALDKLAKHLGLYEKDNEQLGKAIALAFKVSPKDKAA